MRKLTHVKIEGKEYPLKEGHRFIAQDKSGSWFSYPELPKISCFFWYSSSLDESYLCTSHYKPINWKEELYELY